MFTKGRKIISLLLFVALIAATSAGVGAPTYASPAESGAYSHAYACVRLLDGEAYQTGGDGATRTYTYKTGDDAFRPINDDYAAWYGKVTDFIHMVFTGSPAFFEARFDYDEGYGDSAFVFEMLVRETAGRTREAEALARDIVSATVHGDMTIREKYFALYSWMARHISYDGRTADPASAAGRAAYAEGQSFENALLNGQAVCGGIGRAYMLLCRLADLPVLFVTGDAAADHAWNKVYIDGKWLNVDLTDACKRHNIYTGLFAEDDSALTGSRYRPQLADYMDIVPFLYPDLSPWDMAEEPAPLPEQAPGPIPAPTPAYQPGENDIKVIIDGNIIAFDVPPRIVNNRVMVPLRAIFYEMGAEVVWDEAAQAVTAVKGETTVVLTIGDTSPTINGDAVVLDQPGIIVDGRTLAPLRFVAEAFGGSVEWAGDENTAYIAR